MDNTQTLIRQPLLGLVGHGLGAASAPGSFTRQGQRCPIADQDFFYGCLAAVFFVQVLLPIFIVFIVWPKVLKPVALLGLELAGKAIEWTRKTADLIAGKLHALVEG